MFLLCARVFSPAAAILESEKTLGTRLGNGQFIERKGPGNNKVKGQLVSGLVPLHMLNQVRRFGVHFESVQRFPTSFFGSLEIVHI